MKKNVTSTFLKWKVFKYLTTIKVVGILIVVSVLEAGAAKNIPETPDEKVPSGFSEENKTNLFQGQTITGKVVDQDGMPLPGVTVIVKGTTNGTITNLDGVFSLNVSSEAEILKFSFVGMKTLEIPIEGSNFGNIVLEESAVDLEEIVVVGYGTQKEESVTGAISSISTDDLRQSSAANVSVALAGQLPGLTVMQPSGQPGNDDVNFYLRGIGTLNDASPLIMIDGVPRDNISLLDPNEVASISILKDASATAVFGVRGANGVILITTRRGQIGKSELNITVDRSIQSFAVRPDRIHSWEFAELRNEAYLNDNPGTSPDELPYTQYMIDKYRSGEDPVFYPDRDVFDTYFHSWAPQTRVNTNFNGGGEAFTYFLNAGYIGQKGNFKTEPESYLGYDPSYNMDRYNFRGNIDVKLADNLKASLNVSTYLRKTNSPQTRLLFGGSVAGMTQQLMAYSFATPPNDPGPKTVEGYGVPGDEILHIASTNGTVWGNLNRRGYRNETATILNSSLALDWGLDFITTGLSAKGMIAFDSHANTVLQGTRGFNEYGKYVARSAEEESTYTIVRDDQLPIITLSKDMNTYYYANYQFSLNYARSFGVHSFTGMALYQRDSWDTYAADLPYNIIGYVGRATYDYDNRYLAEVNFGYNGSEQFAPANRFGSFPAYSLGWIASNEGFLEGNNVLTHLKFRGSYGIVGNDKLGNDRFLYQSFITMDPGIFPTLGRGQRVSQGRLGNEALQWEKATKRNIGVDIKLLENISLNIDLYDENRNKILINRSTIPALQGVPLGNIPRVNIGVVNNKGYEVELGYRKMIASDFFVSIRGNFNYNKNVVEFADEIQLGEEYAYRYRNTGFSVGQRFGYKIDYSNGNGYINTQEELDNLPDYEIGGVPRLGDFKYVDANDDGVINDRDLVPIGYSSVPRMSYGLSGSVTYKNFDLSFVASGIAQSTVGYANAWGVSEFGLEGFFSNYHKQAWTAESYANGEEILYPALGITRGTSILNNDFFLMDRSFLRLKNVEIGYTFPESKIAPVGIEKVRIYANGNNLFTWHKLPVDTVDPEQTETTVYPLMRMLTVGLNVTF